MNLCHFNSFIVIVELLITLLDKVVSLLGASKSLSDFQQILLFTTLKNLNTETVDVESRQGGLSRLHLLYYLT